MNLYCDKLPGTGYGVILNRLFLLWLCTAPVLRAQDTVALGSVEVKVRKSSLSQIGKKTETLDSAVKQLFRFSSIADALGFNSPVFIKTYGPGGIATTAFRGGNASQTAVLWNGFNIQNAMLGQSDLSQLPLVLFENIEIEYGGSSSLWGSGAVGGSIQLNNRNGFNKGIQTTTSLGGGSFGLLNGSSNLLISKSRFLSSTKVYGNHSENNFKYKDPADGQQPYRFQHHASYLLKGLMQELKFILSSRQILSLNAWASSGYRDLPSVNPSVSSKAYQQDQALRLTAAWSYHLARLRSGLKAGWFSDHINFTDSNSSVFSKSRVQTIIAENENYLDWSRNMQLNVGVNFSSSLGDNDGYAGRRSTSRVSFLGGNKFTLLESRMVVLTNVRVEYFSTGALPVTGNVSAEYSPIRNLVLKTNAARVYRQPTLNELYWIPGGNPSLKPEQGYTYEGDVEYTRNRGRCSLFVSLSAYSRKIDNWILWVPGANANPSPLNVQQVWSRGTETNWKLSYDRNRFRLTAGINSGYVLSTTTGSRQENSNTIGKQLIYTPRYIVNGNISVAYRKSAVTVFHHYNGYSFITSDNSAWLMPYHTTCLKASHALQFKKMALSFFAACNNLFSNSYSIVAGRPMPLRNFELGITFQSKNK